MIYITGDTHIPIDIHKLSMTNFQEQKELTKNDYVIICGDFGGVWNESKEEKYWLKWLNAKPFTTLFVDGNHENFDLLYSKYTENFFNGGKARQIMSSIYHLSRGQVFTLNGIKIFTMGGAESHDKECRREGVSWWQQEMPNVNEYHEAIKNLNFVDWEVDYIITHSAPSAILLEISEYFQSNKLTAFLDGIMCNCAYKHWYFGHYHLDKCIDDKHTAVYNKIIKII